MTKAFQISINILIYWVVVTGLTGLHITSNKIFALVIGGFIFALVALLVEPVLSFFKFPRNFWGLLVVGFIINLSLFIIYSLGFLPLILTVSSGIIGDGLAPIPFPAISLSSPILVAIVAALIATLLQILFRKLARTI